MGEDIVVDAAACEGCGACALACPEHAISLVERVSGEVLTSTTRFGPMVHATLRAGEGASGKLVSEVRQRAEELTRSTGRGLIIIDGPPGTGCPVIATLSGVDLALVVTEPTLSGRQGLARAVEVALHFKVPTCAVVNRADWNPEEARAIEGWCESRGVRTLGRLPYDDAATSAMAVGRTVVEYGEGALSGSLRALWAELEAILAEGRDKSGGKGKVAGASGQVR